MAVTQCMTNQAKLDFLNGVHQPGDVYKIALYTQAAANLNKNTTAYTASGEVSGSGYSAGGNVLSGFTAVLAGDVATIDFTSDPLWSNASLTADAAMIYNSSKSNKALGVYTFQSVTVVNGSFIVQLPAVGGDGSTALVRIT